MVLAEASWLDARGIVTNIVSNILWLPFLALPFVARYLYGSLTRVVRLGLISKLGLSTAVVFVLLGMLLGREAWTALLCGFIALLVTGLIAARGFLKAGISDAFVTTTKGVDYAASLRMARKSISFLGIGADKLTSLKEFESTMRRCGANGNTVKFLLSPPDNPQLETAARRNDADPALYSRNVKNSLRRLADLRRRTGLSIDVRFYPTDHPRDLQQFRLMFIDEKICLLSWTVWDSKLGRNNPQVLLKNRHEAAELSLYKAFKDFYEEIWEDADPIDLSAYE